MKRLFLTQLVLTSILGVHWALAQLLSADPSGGARVVALEMLKKLPARVSTVPSHSPFFVSDRSVLESATLGEPFVMYCPDSAFVAHYDEPEAGDIMQYLWKCVRFPVHVGDRVLGIINIREGKNGVWTASTRTVGDRTVKIMEECRRSAAITAGQRISMLSIGFAGRFGIVEDGTRIIALMPLDTDTSRLVEDAISPNAESPWIQPERVFPIIKAKVRATRESEQFQQPADDRQR